MLEAVKRMLHAVEGAYALGISAPTARTGSSPRGRTRRCCWATARAENFLASDVTAIIRHTRDIAYMEDGELAVLTREGIRVYDALEPRSRRSTTMWTGRWTPRKRAATHFMLKEIMEQPAAPSAKATAARIQGGRVVLQDLTCSPSSRSGNRPHLHCGLRLVVPCGHGGQVQPGADLLRRSVEVCWPPSSGTATPSWAKGAGHRHQPVRRDAGHHGRPAGGQKARGHILSIVNVVGSSIARESDDVLYTWAGPEIAVATTKAYAPRWRC